MLKRNIHQESLDVSKEGKKYSSKLKCATNLFKKQLWVDQGDFLLYIFLHKCKNTPLSNLSQWKNGQTFIEINH